MDTGRREPSTRLIDEWYEISIHDIPDFHLRTRLNTLRETCVTILCGLKPNQEHIRNTRKALEDVQKKLVWMQKQKLIPPHNQRLMDEVDRLYYRTYCRVPHVFGVEDHDQLPRLSKPEA